MDEKSINTLNDIAKEKLEKNKKLLKTYLAFFFLMALLIASYSFGRYEGRKENISQKEVPLSRSLIENKLPGESEAVDFSLFWKVWDLVKEKHIDRESIDAQKLVYGAISGMLRATDDPYSSFFNPEENKSFNENLEGSFEGIGAELGFQDEILTIVAPLEGTPSQKAGLLPGDKILKIDDKIITDLTLDEAVSMIKGPKGSQVKLTILRLGEQDTREVTVTRDIIEVKSVTLEFKDDIAIIKLSKFGENTDKEFKQAVVDILSRKAKGVVVDLRNNPGGYLDSSVTIASYMIPKGKVVVIEEDSAGNREDLKTLGGDKLGALPIVVLINQGSASASEILAGALRDNLGTTLIGKKSFGKGSVQELQHLPGGSSVKITVANWLTPNGHYIMDKGIEPDIEIDLTKEDVENKRDPQMEKALEAIRGKISN